jgi:hypothetical protein
LLLLLGGHCGPDGRDNDGVEGAHVQPRLLFQKRSAVGWQGARHLDGRGTTQIQVEYQTNIDAQIYPLRKPTSIY